MIFKINKNNNKNKIKPKQTNVKQSNAKQRKDIETDETQVKCFFSFCRDVIIQYYYRIINSKKKLLVFVSTYTY